MKLTFDHAASVVPDIAEAVDWYVNAIPGTVVLYQDSSWAFLDANGADLEALAQKHGKSIDYHRDGTRGYYLSAPGGGTVEIICMTGTQWEVPGEDNASV